MSQKLPKHLEDRMRGLTPQQTFDLVYDWIKEELRIAPTPAEKQHLLDSASLHVARLETAIHEATNQLEQIKFCIDTIK